MENKWADWHLRIHLVSIRKSNWYTNPLFESPISESVNNIKIKHSDAGFSFVQLTYAQQMLTFDLFLCGNNHKKD